MQNRDMATKVLLELDGGGLPIQPIPRYPLIVEVRSIKEDFRHFRRDWFKLHMRDFVKIKIEEEEERVSACPSRRLEIIWAYWKAAQLLRAGVPDEQTGRYLIDLAAGDEKARENRNRLAQKN